MIQQIISNPYENAKRIQLNSSSKLILFSNLHRGDNSYADDFKNNRNIYFQAIRNYYENDFTRFEFGDGTELWKIYNFKNISEYLK